MLQVRPPLFLVVTLAVILAPRAVGTQATGTIHGRVEILQDLPPVERRPGVSELGMPPPRQAPDRRRSVVYLETAPLGAFEHAGERHLTMDQRAETFVPHVLAVTMGTVVDFRNSDQTYHNVFSLSRTKTFDLGRYATGHVKSVRFDRPGIVRVFCDIHSHMSAFVLVFGHRFFAVTGDDGSYRLDDVPPGTYTVRVWNEALPEDGKLVHIPEAGAVVELNFALGHGAAQRVTR